MAARQQHVQDSAVVERRLRPIYEWLDSGNPKKALQETEKVLRKTPNLQCAKGLKALSLLQLGRENECLRLLEALAQETPSDNSTLQVMTICYRDLGQLDKVCGLYESALASDPENEELHTHLFMSYVRTSNFKKQHRAALALYKIKRKKPYFCWAVMSTVLDAVRGAGATDHAKRNLLLSLAERMLENLSQADKVKAEAEAQLYLIILERQGQFERALSVLDGPLSNKVLTGASTDPSRIAYLTSLGRWQDLCKLCTDLLNSNMDRWDIWQHYLTSVFEMAKAGHTNSLNNHAGDCSEMGLDDSAEKAHEFICSLIENAADDNLFKSSSSYHLRGPYLARFELCSRLKNLHKDPTYLLGDTFELFVEYFRIFGHKPCCVSDLRIYLHLLEAERRAQLASQLLKHVGICSTTLPQSENQMQRHICALELSRLCGSHASLDVEYQKALIAALQLHYQNGAREFGGSRLPTDQGPADAYALLAVHTLYDLALRLQDSAPLVTAVILLENLLKASPSNFHAKLLCVRLYHLIGCAEGAHVIYDSLDVKHLQMDTLGFVHCSLMQPTGLLNLTATVQDATLKFFSTNYRDSIDHLTFSYKFGSFHKLEEFMNFRERLNNSLHYTLTAIDRTLLELLSTTDLQNMTLRHTLATPKYKNIDWDALRDNSDYAVYVSWDPERAEHPTDPPPELKHLFEQDRDLARFRAGLLGGVRAALELLRASNETRPQQRQTLEETHREWLQTIANIEGKAYTWVKIQNHLSLPPPSRLHGMLTMPYKQIVDPLLRLILGATAAKGSTAVQENGVDAKLSIHLGTLSDSVVKLIGEPAHNRDGLWELRISLETVVNCVEILCIACVLCTIAHNLIHPAKPSAANSKKTKKKVHHPQPEASVEMAAPPHEVGSMAERLAEAVGTLRRGCASVDQQLGRWSYSTPLHDVLQKLNALQLDVDPGAALDPSVVLSYVAHGHATAVKELRAALQAKERLLASISC